MAANLTPASAEVRSDSLGFLAGGGEMGARTRHLDWSRSPVGPIEAWPQSLKTAVSLCLGSRHPMVVWWGRPGYTQFYNDAYISFLGRAKHPAFLGRSARDCWSEIWSIIEPMLDGVYETGEATWSEDLLFVLNRHLPREEGYFTFSYSPIRADDGRIDGIFCACNETTTRVVGERRLRTLRDLNLVAAEANTVQGACERAARIMGDNPADIPFALIYLLDADEDQALLAATTALGAGSTAAPRQIDMQDLTQWPLRQALESAQSRLVADLASRFGPLPGGSWPESAEAALIVPIAAPGQGRPIGFLVSGLSPRRVLDADYRSFLELVSGHIGSSITNSRAHEDESRRAEALAALDRAKTAFFSNVSHEFRTPLTLILGPLQEALADSASSQRGRERLELAQRNALRLLKLVNSLLDFSRIEAGRVQASYEPTDLAALTHDLASTFRSAMERAGLQFEVFCDTLDEPVCVDRDMWEKIILNLLSNAFKFTFTGGVAVRLHRDDGHALLEVTDTGVGIPEEELPRLFERFHRVEGTQGRSQEGSGIGLALVQELVKLHGGTIEASSALSRGTTFRLRIPFGTAHLPQARLKAGKSLPPTATGARPYIYEALRCLEQETTDGISSAGGLPDNSLLRSGERASANTAARIVVADDNADMRTYLHDLLASRYAVEAVADGAQALEAIRRVRPDLVISDVMMPRLDGFGLLGALRADETLAKIPVLLLSARAGEESRIEGLQAGADDYLVKPFSARELLARVEASLTLARVRGDFERHIATDLEAMTRLRALAETCAKEGCTLRDCLEGILGTAIAITGADKGNLQLLDRESGALIIAAERGFEPPFLEFFSKVQEGEATACGSALRLARRTVVPDVSQSELFAGTAARAVMLEAGVQAVQSTPLLSSLGRVLGMVSTHFCRPHQPSERELQLLDLLSRQAADFLESRAAEEGLRSSELRFQTVLDASPAALTLLSAVRDASGTIVDFKWRYLNKPAQEMIRSHVGVPAQELIGKQIKEVLPHVWEDSGLFESFVRATQTGTLQRIESAGRSAGFSGTYLNLAAPFEDGVLVWFIDVTAQKRAEQKLLEEDRRKNEFLAMLAHELRSPLAPIRNANELLARLVSAPDERIGRAIDVTRRQVTQLSRLVDDLLDVSRVTQGRIELRRRAVEVSHIIALAVETVQSLMSEKRHRFSVVSSAQSGLYIDADPARVTQCVVNVLTNAAKYTDAGGEICLSSHAEGDRVTIEVSDTGVGIAPELLPHVFDLFVQGERALDRSQGGLGVGLAVTKRLLEMHQGTIIARSPGLGGGSTFAIQLPLIKRPATSAAGPDTPEAPAVRVLIVDDNQDSADSLAALLRLEEHDARAVYTAGQALEQAGLLAPDIVLLDIGLPGMNGYEVAQQLRRMPQLRGTRLVALTGYGQREDRRRAQAAGFDAYLIKPVSLTRLAHTIAGLAGKPHP